MLTYQNDLQSVGVLSHELGHAYQYRLFQDLFADVFTGLSTKYGKNFINNNRNDKSL
ncbi:hypothetical protein KW850_27060 [Bacillus sp. sid0103]|uniref:hypothetical protein n=1 Tax=Bacillus sp. sid0103 TaxID=2856337 RepID=UPI001C442109|nr:hypothetical protein [Bacillus sp. sid0103]MBV7508866.1 hypothetical protein [Bacillus sp. sid0103]